MDARTLLTLALMLGTACRTTPSTPPPPPLQLSFDAYVGTIHTGPVVVESEGAPSFDDSADAWWFELEIAYAVPSSTPVGEPISALTRQVFVESDEATVQTHSVLASGVLCSRPSAPDPHAVSLARQANPLWPGTTATWRARQSPDALKAPRMRWRELEFELARSPDAAEPVALAVVFEGEVDPRDRATSDAPRSRVQREHLVLDPLADPGQTPLRIFLPAPRDEAPSGGYQVELRRVSPPTGAELAHALERSRVALSRSSAHVRATASALSASEGFRFERASALRALEDRSLRRPALVFLAQACGAALTGELAIDAEPAALESYLSLLSARARANRGAERDLADHEPHALGWMLESASYTWLAERAANDKAPLELELQALLLVHAGALARFPDLLLDAVRESEGSTALDHHLEEENRNFLEDGDPAARLRAFEWLRARGAALGNFDPLAPLAERRAALDAARGGAR